MIVIYEYYLIGRVSGPVSLIVERTLGILVGNPDAVVIVITTSRCGVLGVEGKLLCCIPHTLHGIRKHRERTGIRHIQIALIVGDALGVCVGRV